jgi:hypothetical protein
MEVNEPKTPYSTDRKRRTFEPKPQRIPIEKLGPWLVERNRTVLDMLEEYDRRQEKRVRTRPEFP